MEITVIPFFYRFCTPDSSLVIRIQKSTSHRLAGDDLAKELPRRCFPDPSRENQDVIRHPRRSQAPTVQLYLDKIQGLKTMETYLPAYTWKYQRPPKSCGCCQLLYPVSDKKSVQMNTSSSAHPWCGSQPGEVLTAVLWCPGRAATQRLDNPWQRGSQASRREDHGKL